jgi:hypothetical protein
VRKIAEAGSIFSWKEDVFAEVKIENCERIQTNEKIGRPEKPTCREGVLPQINADYLKNPFLPSFKNASRVLH